ncbi:hypothetical protein HG537_0E02490 [Torulaspora globosa]|uniref:Uncharacterized protein n=1 Tax=Torulaspora globosa TaxID=48254 RepID=A0A7H9HT40_9SACH|nr:hypothetical protein HG537_0E02490 [Torulaspora sp. CBS 2947]
MEVLIHSYLLLNENPGVLDANFRQVYDERTIDLAREILNGQSYAVVEELAATFPKFRYLPASIDENDLLVSLREFVDEWFTNNESYALLFAIALLQTFIQNNYTGPLAAGNVQDLLFRQDDVPKSVGRLAVSLLGSGGQSAYDLVKDPVCLILSLLMLEKLTKRGSSFANDFDTERDTCDISATSTPGLLAIAHWWYARALLARLSLLREPAGSGPAIASSIFSSIDLAHAITKDLPPEASTSLKSDLYTTFYLENVKCSLAINTEHLCLPSLTKVKKLTNFQFVLTGARAKRTKFQQKSFSGLIILAKSSSTTTVQESSDRNPDQIVLESDILLEKPHFEDIGSEPLDEQIVKKQKVAESDALEEDKLLPVAIRQENIPAELRSLDPNEQPQLTGYDNVQLLLRLYVLRQTSPAKDPLVEEELGAIISRVIYQNGRKDWTIFSRALWERSIVETCKAKTIERGLLQMQSLVEELGIKIQTRLIPSSHEAENNERLRYVHQLPFIPHWELEATLAEKFMSLGVLKSAVEIYERLQMACEAALCYAAVGDEKTAEEILLKRIEQQPKDARAYSILGDIRQDPDLWQKSWEIGKYVNAKNSLGKYYYNPPASSGLSRNYNLTLKHLNDSLRQYPLNFETWYFYGCVGLECGKFDVAAEAFSRCVSLDQTHAMAWSNLSAAYVELDKLKEALSCLKRAVASDSQKNWRIWENYMIVAAKLNEWNDVLLACRRLINIKRDKVGEGSIDLPIVEKLTELLVSTEYPMNDSPKLTHFQRSCIELVCDTLPSVITTNARCWRLVAKVELWRKRPWMALECHEKAYRPVSHNPDIEIDEKIWNETVDACEDLVAAYESLGELEGRHGPGSLVCKDWKYKSRATIKGLLSKGKGRWDNSDGWERLLEMRKQI